MKNTLALFLLAAPTWAATITFGTGGTTGFTSGGATVSVNNAAGITGLLVTVTAGVLSPNTCDNTCLITSSNAGYGVNNAPNGNDGSMDIDGSGYDDFIRVTFNQTVTLTGATFGSFSAQAGDNGRLYNGTTNAILINSFNTSSLTGLSYSGTSFLFAAIGNDDAYRLRSVTFDVAPTSTTPEPSSFALIGLGLTGVFALTRKRRTNA